MSAQAQEQRVATAADDRAKIRALIKSINQAWLQDRVEELEQFFHPDIVMVRPGFSDRSEGRAAAVKSYEDFIAHATIREYRESEAAVDLFGDTAIATYQFHMLYEMTGESFRESGRDLFIFARSGNGWQAVWRTMFLASGPSA